MELPRDCQPPGLKGIACGRSFVAFVLQKPGQHLSYGAVVVDD
jgi:hypothetical protein